MPNQLAESMSPYLRQHADNPVHWREWSEAAFAEAASRDVPVLLSVGYAACHWCHVMAHESFEDAVTAEQMNTDFVCVKVDREERPDIDAVYMNATAAMTGQGGWPMTCFLTPTADPFYCGTYFPATPRSGMPSFRQLLTAITKTWTERRDEIVGVGARVRDHLRATASALPAATFAIDDRLLDHAVTSVLGDEDREHGGFGGAPKFPPSALLEGLIRHAERTGSADALDAVRRTCVVMARGGIYDQLAGGFARYAVDSDWVVPHFEKMLYDNAQLLRAYAHLARIDGDDLSMRVTGEIVEFLTRDLRVAGGFASALDADAAGVEGSTYVWTPQQLVDALGDDDGRWAAELFGVNAAGTFEHGSSTLQLPADPDDRHRYSRVRRALLAARAHRPQPARDDKVVTGWNALAITALVEAGAGLRRPDWVELAAEVARELLDRHRVDGVLHRASLGGRVGAPMATLDDHAALCTALFALYQVTGEKNWHDAAFELLDATVETFADPAEPGSWYDTAVDDLIARPRDPIDGATPAGASLVAEALLSASLLASADPAARYAEMLDATLGRGAVVLTKLARSGGQWLTVVEAVVAGPVQIAVSQHDGSSGALAQYAREVAAGGTTIVAGQQDSIPLLMDRGPVGGADAAYLCRGSVCDLPVTDPAALAAALASRGQPRVPFGRRAVTRP